MEHVGAQEVGEVRQVLCGVEAGHYSDHCTDLLHAQIAEIIRFRASLDCRIENTTLYQRRPA